MSINGGQSLSRLGVADPGKADLYAFSATQLSWSIRSINTSIAYRFRHSFDIKEVGYSIATILGSMTENMTSELAR